MFAGNVFGNSAGAFVMHGNIVKNARFTGAAKGSAGAEVTEPK
jgi:hypothetical protein